MKRVSEAVLMVSFQVSAERVRSIYSIEEVQNAWEKMKSHLLNVKIDNENGEAVELAKKAALETVKGELLLRALKKLIEDNEAVGHILAKEIEENLKAE